MHKKSQSWFVPLLILLAVLWAMGKKGTPPAQVQPSALSTSSTLTSNTPTSLSASAPSPGSAIDQFVSVDILDVREQPSGKVISKLKRGEKVQVFETRNEWTRISIDGQPGKWLSSKNLCSGSSCYVQPEPKPIRQTLQPTHKPTSEYNSS